ncbi:ERV-BabFcenv provirus ancestral Env polyprotein-like [Trachypithecus francoisi]|uniref:ERV-BabFcenv provirus ancestral Env polyprotein-like n=1 Tax=Trachypithecus francoisi TaxID=54180 RepID=UPI00141AD2AB|nr:ERV-BabFcenv provirus ancestral Env polyprotein-like [Trachypithecus francoisi]
MQLGSLTLMLVTLVATGANTKPVPNPSVWRFWLYENRTHPGQPRKPGKLLASADCPSTGCSDPILLNFTGFQIAKPVVPMICFEFDQTKYNCKHYWWHQNAGCPYSYCKMHSVRGWNEQSGWNFYQQGRGGIYTWIVKDSWNSRWTTPQHGAVYYSSSSTWPSSHLYLWRGLVQVRPLVHGDIQQQEDRLTQDLRPFSWLELLQEGLELANLTGLHSLSGCFLCATLGHPPLTTVPLPWESFTQTNNLRNLSNAPILNVLLYQNPSQEKFPYCFSGTNSSLCNVTVTPPNTNLRAPPGIFFWCNGTLSKTLSGPSVTNLLCLHVTLVPRLTLLTAGEFLGYTGNWTSTAIHPVPRLRHARAIFLPLIAGISLTTSLIAARLAVGALGHTLIESNKLYQQFAIAMEESAESLASLQRQLTSLAQVTLQNRRALDLLTAEKGGTCMFLKEDCCFYINESGLH